ncbi:MAG: phenylacetic acid degradation operon negative regulatory protein PaaX [Hyphomicrobiales bacterium]|nr:phenylacetic acid degradation operon negative regulatory protein PaaX [Hyphomicrobiales bacterium]
MRRHRRGRDIVARLLEQLKPKAKSLIITVYGDAVMHHGGVAWLGSIIKLVEPLGLNERVVRTSVFRLASEGWLTAEQVGRRSYYRLTEIGRHRVDAALGRIYFHTAPPWDHRWTIVITDPGEMSAEHREGLREDLRWQGFGQLTGDIMLHPGPDEAALRQALLDASVSEHTLVMRATAESWVAPGALREVINRSWSMERLATDYTAFLDAFRPVWQILRAVDELQPQTCFVVRMLLMHAYRRVLLRDPKLPDELLETDWPGTSARLLCRNLYRLVQASAEQYLMTKLETVDGGAPEAHPSYYARFGGLEAAGEPG